MTLKKLLTLMLDAMANLEEHQEVTLNIWANVNHYDVHYGSPLYLAYLKNSQLFKDNCLEFTEPVRAYDARPICFIGVDKIENDYDYSAVSFLLGLKRPKHGGFNALALLMFYEDTYDSSRQIPTQLMIIERYEFLLKVVRRLIAHDTPRYDEFYKPLPYFATYHYNTVLISEAYKELIYLKDVACNLGGVYD